MVAADFGNADVARTLVRHKADVAAVAGDASTALLLACISGSHDVMSVLLDEGRANPNPSGDHAGTCALTHSLYDNFHSD